MKEAARGRKTPPADPQFIGYPMSAASDTRHPPDYDPRYLAGIAWFNRGEFFEAHEVWEDLWRDCPGADRRFYQALIQAAVALHHWGNRNRAGATRLFHSGRRYMEPYRPRHHGLDVDGFWRQVEEALAVALSEASGRREPAVDGEKEQPAHAGRSPNPTIALDSP